MGLTLNPIMFLGGGSVDLGAAGRDVIQYEVLGLPAKQAALIARKDGQWRILRVQDNVPGAWCGNHQTAEAALAALAAETAT